MDTPALRHFVVTGTARSGTTYTAAVLANLGLRVDHETVFRPQVRGFPGWGDAHGDVSWLAAPFLDQIGDALVAHQLRHPLRVVRSLVGTDWLGDRTQAYLRSEDLWCSTKAWARSKLAAAGQVEPSPRGSRSHLLFRRFLDAYAPEVWEPGTVAERSLAYWVTWTRKVRAAAGQERYLAYHVETMTPDDLVTLLGRIGLEVTPAHVAVAMTKIRDDLNTRRRAELEWDDLPATALRRKAGELAEELGYDPRDVTAPPRSLEQA